jgi:hypothetical protein
MCFVIYLVLERRHGLVSFLLVSDVYIITTILFFYCASARAGLVSRAHHLTTPKPTQSQGVWEIIAVEM